ncbi:hypothetical protein ACS0TY_024753 [Phlomoides rotata]
MNRGEPSNDLSKIWGEILSSGDPFTLPRTYTCTECSYGKVDSWGGAGTPARITGDSYKNGGEVNSTRRHSGMDVDPSGRDNHSGPGRSSTYRKDHERGDQNGTRIHLRSRVSRHIALPLGSRLPLGPKTDQRRVGNLSLSFHTIDRHRLISIFKEEIDDPKFFYSIQKVFSAGRLVGGEKGPYSVPHSVLLSALPGNIYLHKLDQDIGRIRQKYEILIVQRIRSVLLRTGCIDDQENSGEEASFNAPQDNRAIIVGRVKSIQHRCSFHSLVSSWQPPPPSTSTPRLMGDQKRPFIFPPSSALAAFLNKPSSLLCAAFLIEAAGLTPKAEFYGRERYSAGSTTIAARSTVEFLGTVIREVPPGTTPIQFLRELEKRLRVKHRIHITACHLRSTIHSKLRNIGKSIPIKQLAKGMSGTRSLLDAVQLAETLGTAGVRSPQVSVLWGTIKHIRQGSKGISLLHSSGRSKVPSDVQQAVSRSGTHARKLSLYTPAGRKAAREGGEHWARSISSEFPIQMEAPIKKILRRLRDRGLISRRRPWPIHAACLTNVSDEDIVN